MRWPWQRANPCPDVLTLDDIVTAGPEVIAAVTGQPPPEPNPEYGSWRIERDPHAEKYDCQQYGYGWPFYMSSRPFWHSRHTAASEEAARQWIADEQKRPIIVAEIPAKTPAPAGGEHDEPITDASLKPGMNP
jgi:hypothetical protein